MSSLNEIIEGIIQSSQLGFYVIIFAAISLLLYLLFLISFTIFGFWMSELGLWLAWIPLTLITIGVPFTIKMHFVSQFSPINPFFMSIGLVANTITFMSMMIPFFKISMTNKRLRKAMEKSLGKNYLDIIDANLMIRFSRTVKFKLTSYFLGSRIRLLRKSIVINKGITYKKVGDTNLQLNVYAPRRAGTFPVIVFVHGGGWMTGSKDRYRDERVCKILANHGYVVFNIDYRLFPSKANNISEMLSDVRAAVKFARQNAPAFFGDPDNLFLFGRSAGAHLSLLCAFTQEGPFFEDEEYKKEDLEVAGVIAFYPPTNLKALYDFFRIQIPKIILKRIMGGKPQDKKELYQLLSPVNYLNEQVASTIPPVFLATGLNDRLVDPEQSKELHEKLQRLKIPAVLLEFPNANHSFDMIQMGPNGQLVYKYLTQFLVWVLTKRKWEMKNTINYSKVKEILSQEKKQPSIQAPFFEGGLEINSIRNIASYEDFRICLKKKPISIEL